LNFPALVHRVHGRKSEAVWRRRDTNMRQMVVATEGPKKGVTIYEE